MTALQATPWKPQVVTLQATAKAGRAAQTLQQRQTKAEAVPQTLQRRQTWERHGSRGVLDWLTRASSRSRSWARRYWDPWLSV